MPEGLPTSERRPPEESYRLGLEMAGHVYFEFDPRSRRTVVGTPWTVLGYAPDEISPSIDAWLELVHPEDRPQLTEGMRRQHQGAMPVHRIEYRMRGRDGTWRAVLVSTRALARDPDGVPLRTAGTITDVTDAAVLREQALYADRLASLGSLASGVAHAVNNPLASVTSSLKVLQEELERCVADPARVSEKSTELRQAIADAVTGADRVRDVVRGLQLFSAPRGSGRGSRSTCAPSSPRRSTSRGTPSPSARGSPWTSPAGCQRSPRLPGSSARRS